MNLLKGLIVTGTLSLILAPIANAQPDPRNRIRPPHDRIDRGPNLGAVILQMTDQIMVHVNPSTSTRSQELTQLRYEIEQCRQMRNEYITSCYSEKSTEFIQLAFAPEYASFGSCTVSSEAGNAALWQGDGENFAAIPNSDKTCNPIGAGARFEKLTQNRVRYHASGWSYFDGYQIRITSGNCAGAIGYLLYVHVEESCKD